MDSICQWGRILRHWNHEFTAGVLEEHDFIKIIVRYPHREKMLHLDSVKEENGMDMFMTPMWPTGKLSDGVDLTLTTLFLIGHEESSPLPDLKPSLQSKILETLSGYFFPAMEGYMHKHFNSLLNFYFMRHYLACSLFVNPTLGKSLLSSGPLGALLDLSFGHGVCMLPCFPRCFPAVFSNCFGIQITTCGVLLGLP